MTDWHKHFTVICISRADLRQTGLTDEQIAQLSNGDMEAIAQEMDNYIEDSLIRMCGNISIKQHSRVSGPKHKGVQNHDDHYHRLCKPGGMGYRL